MADSWGGSWGLSWLYSWGRTDTEEPAQTGGAGYFSYREYRRKKRKNTLLKDIEQTYNKLSEVKKEIEQARTVNPEPVVIEAVTIEPVQPDFTPLLRQMKEYEDRLARLQVLVAFLERQQDEEDVMLLLQSLPFVSV